MSNDTVIRRYDAPAQAALAWATVFTAFHVYWFCGGRFGFGDQPDPIPQTRSAGDVVFMVVTGGMFVAGFLVPSAVLARWGRNVPRRLLLALALTGGALLLARGLSGLVDDALRTTGVATHGLTGMSNEEVLGDAHPTPYTWWSTVGVDTTFALGGVLYGWLWWRLRNGWR